MSNFSEAEYSCQLTYSELGDCWHLYTPENCPIIFTTHSDYKAGMNLFGIAALLNPKVKVITFELMSNHIHATLSGRREDIIAFFNLFRTILCKYLKSQGNRALPTAFEMQLRQLEDINDVRTVIIYNNRNAYLVHPEHSPYTYPYGANSYYFNPLARKYYESSRVTMRAKDLERLAHTHSVRQLDQQVYMIDGYICPFCYCDITVGEHLFRNNRHYYYSLTKNVESQKKIAMEIGEKVFYTDDELFSIAFAIAQEQYKLAPSQLPVQAKQEFAKKLHYEYNAGNKQISRIVKLDISVVNQLFPTLK
ncbi:MAG: hypothetical protein J5667_00770 [Bacteroidales bacterium]|nr:hypothetical protein [Bacteroidales bacterium]